MGFKDSSIYAKVSLPWIVVGFIFHVIGFPTDSWVDTNGGNVGLFRICGDIIGCVSTDSDAYPGWFRVSMAFEIIGFIFLLVALIVTIIHVVIVNHNRIVLAAAIITNSVAIIFIFIGFVVYAGRFGEMWSEVIYDLGWSFALVVVSYVCLFIGLICLFLDLCVPNAQSHRFPVNDHA